MIHGAVSRQTVLAMAGNLRNISNSDMSIAISGIAGPSGGTSGKPVGTVFIGLSTVKKLQRKNIFSPEIANPSNCKLVWSH